MKNYQKYKNRSVNIVIATSLYVAMKFSYGAEIEQIEVIPSDTDGRINTSNLPHVVAYDKAIKNADLLLWLAGTGGHPKKSEKITFPVFAAQNGYRVVQLSYIDDDAVAQVCKANVLKSDPDCAENFRRKRVFGTGDFDLIKDQPHDSIINRFLKLIMHLQDTQPHAGWNQYLKGDQLLWDRIVVTGQSQGGGMAAFIAKELPVRRVVMLSGGWDKSAKDQIASWYSRSSATPTDRWYATYHVEEPQAGTMAEIYKVLGIPPSHIGALNFPVKGAKAHTEGVSNPEYAFWWKEALGK